MLGPAVLLGTSLAHQLIDGRHVLFQVALVLGHNRRSRSSVTTKKPERSFPLWPSVAASQETITVFKPARLVKRKARQKYDARQRAPPPLLSGAAINDTSAASSGLETTDRLRSEVLNLADTSGSIASRVETHALTRLLLHNRFQPAWRQV